MKSWKMITGICCTTTSSVFAIVFWNTPKGIISPFGLSIYQFTSIIATILSIQILGQGIIETKEVKK